MSFTRVQFAKDLLSALGNTNPSPRILAFIVGWSTIETNTNSGAKFNLLNTTQGGEGATNYNSAGVKNFPNYQTGINATISTLRNGYYTFLEESLRDNLENNLADNPPDEILHELHTWSGDPNGYGTGLVKLGSTHLNDAFDYGTSPNNHPPVVNLPTSIQIDEAENRWKCFLTDCPTGTGIYNSWLNEWTQNLRVFGPPITKEIKHHDWDNNGIVYQIFAHATCEWDGMNAHWYDGRGKITA